MLQDTKRWRQTWRASLAGLSMVLASASACFGAELGTKIERFALPDIHGKDRSLDEFAKSDLVVVAFLGTECPLARLYAPRLQQLSTEFASKGVAFLAIDANSQDSLTDMLHFVNQMEISYPLLKDRDQSIADQFGAERTPEVFLLDKDRKIRYRGRIDDQYGIGSASGYAKTDIKERNLADAIEELLAGKEVSKPKVQALGCLIGRSPKTAAQGDVTYSKHIAGMMQDKCVSCHRPNQIGPFELMTFEQVAGWGPMIKEVVSDGRMPPWGADTLPGKFANDCRLNDAEKQMLFAWVDNGCPEGNPADLPPAKTWVDGWGIPQPDQVIKMTRAIHIPAEGVMPYQFVTVDPGWTEDKWISAVECLPGVRAVVHHVIVSIVPPGGGGRNAGAGAGRQQANAGGAQNRQGGLQGANLGQLQERLGNLGDLQERLGNLQGGGNLGDLQERLGELQGRLGQAGGAGGGDIGALLQGLRERGGAAGGAANGQANNQQPNNQQRRQGGQAGGLGGLGGGGGLAGIGGGGAMLTAYVPGTTGEIFPEGVAQLVPAGSKLSLQIHYTPNGKAVDDITSIGVCFADASTVKKKVHTGSASNFTFSIPPNSDGHEVVAETTIRYDQNILWMSPHMHVRGKAMRFDATYPDGTKETLLDIPDYDFNWQLHYTFAEPKFLPAGTRLKVTGVFDNTDGNPANPDPNKRVRFGLQTWEEMMIGFYSTISIRDDAVAANDVKKPAEGAAQQ